MITQKLDETAATLTGIFFSNQRQGPIFQNQVPVEFSKILDQLEPIFPGIEKAFMNEADVNNREEVACTFAGNKINCLMMQGTEDSLKAAIIAVKELRGLVEGSSVVSSSKIIQTLITQAGGIFIGKDELVKLGELSADFELPKIPEKFSAAFFNTNHPIRGGTIATHVILGFDAKTNQWYCVEKSIVPESCGLSGSKQDKLLKNKDDSQIEVEGVKVSSPKVSEPIERVLDNVIALHLKDGKSIEEAPFRGVWARTGDTDRGIRGSRFVLGCSSENGIDTRSEVQAEFAYPNNFGLLVGWN